MASRGLEDAGDDCEVDAGSAERLQSGGDVVAEGLCKGFEGCGPCDWLSLFLRVRPVVTEVVVEVDFVAFLVESLREGRHVFEVVCLII